MTPGGVVQRVLTEPFKTEYLSEFDEEPKWSENERDAFFFTEHSKADDAAKALRARLNYHAIYAAVRLKPIPHAPVAVPQAKHKRDWAREVYG